MADPDRLSELRRQRTLLTEHLAWLDLEIERAGPPAASKPKASASSQVASPIKRQLSSSVATETSIEDWVREHQPAEPQISKTGCWIGFAAVTIVGLGLVAGFMILKY